MECSMIFGSTCLEEDKEKVKTILSVENVAREEKYLGLPTPEGCMKKDNFKSTKEIMAKRFTSWVEQYMSRGAKEVLIKLVAQAILTAVMGCLSFQQAFVRN
jgi:hypothetical protein